MPKRSDDYWKEREEELTELIKQRELINEEKRRLGKKIAILKSHISQHYKLKENAKETEVYKMFGKWSLNDLTSEERKAYYTARQRVCREKQKALKM